MNDLESKKGNWHYGSLKRKNKTKENKKARSTNYKSHSLYTTLLLVSSSSDVILPTTDTPRTFAMCYQCLFDPSVLWSRIRSYVRMRCVKLQRLYPSLLRMGFHVLFQSNHQQIFDSTNTCVEPRNVGSRTTATMALAIGRSASSPFFVCVHRSPQRFLRILVQAREFRVPLLLCKRLLLLQAVAKV